MSLRRWALAGLLPLGIVGTVGAIGEHHVAQAAPAMARATTAPAKAKLPQGIRQTADGRYMRRMCPHCDAYATLPETWQPGMALPARIQPLASLPPMAPKDMVAAYNLPAAAAANGKIVAIIDAPDSNAFTDLTGYRAAYTLPALPKCTGATPTGSLPACFAQVGEDGGPSTGQDNPDDDIETSLDMDMISGTCPDCSILLVEINSFCGANIVQGVETAIRLGASAVSISLGGIEATDPNANAIDAGTEDAGLSECPLEVNWHNDPPGPFSTPGHLVFAASGDFGWNSANEGLTDTVGGASPSWPASSPYAIAVGGTAVYKSTAATPTYGEGVWDNGAFGLDLGTSATSKYQDITTSGCSTEFSMPPWQASSLAGTGCTHRATADLAAAADFFNGTTHSSIAAYITEGTQSGIAGVQGTSAASPMVAGIFTRLGLTTEASNDLSWVYSHASAFNDVGSSGYPLPSGAATMNAPSNASCGKLCTIGAGWDGPTGVGSPNGTALAALPVSTSGPVAYPDAGVVDPWDGGGLEGSSSSSSGGSSSGSSEDAGPVGGSSSSSSSGGGSSSGGSSSGTSSSGGIGTSSGATSSSGGTSSGSSGDGGTTSSGGGNSSGGCSVVATGSEASGFGLWGAALGLVGALARRRRARK